MSRLTSLSCLRLQVFPQPEHLRSIPGQGDATASALLGLCQCWVKARQKSWLASQEVTDLSVQLPGGGGGQDQVRGESWRNERAGAETSGDEPGSHWDVEGRVTGGTASGAQGP